MTEHTKPDDATKAAEAQDAQRAHDAGAEPTAEEARAAEEQSVSPGVAEAHTEMREIGANVEGEGQPEP